MIKFDFIDAAASAYRFVMIEHQAIYEMALIPLMVKLACFVFITMAGLESDFLKQGLILMPSYFLEGWMIAQILRLAMLGERWPASLSGDMAKDAALLAERKRCLQASMVMYVLIKTISTGIAGWSIAQGAAMQEAGASAQPDGVSMTMALILFATCIWMFRLLWLHIPLALGQSANRFLDSIKPYSSSIYMIGTWILCAVPVAFLLLTLSQMLGTALGVEDGQEPGMLYTYIVVILQAVLELFTALVSSLAIAYTIASLTKNDKAGRP